MTTRSNGRGLATAGAVRGTHRWIANGMMLMKGYQFNRNLRLRANLTPIPARKARIDPAQSGLCPICRLPGTLAHILQQCPRTHGPRIERHNSVAKFVLASLRRAGYECLEEPRIPVGASFLKPDMVLWNKDHAIVLDVAICRDDVPPDVAHRDKIAKYRIPAITAWVRETTGVQHVEYSGVCLNWRGLWSPLSACFMSRIGLKTSDLMIASVRVLDMGHFIWKCWNNSTWMGTRSGEPRQ